MVMEKQDTIKYSFGDDDKFFFIHIPRTGGTSFSSIIASIFSGALYPFPPANNQPERHEAFDPDVLKNYRGLSGHWDYGVARKPAPWRLVPVTILRDPIKRFVSHYNFAATSGAWFNAPIHEKINAGMSVHDFATDPEMIRSVENFQTRQIAGYKWSEPYADITDSDLLKLAKENLRRFPFFGLTERFSESLLLLFYTFDWQPAEGVPALNTAPKKADHSTLSQETIDAISAISELDIELYQYANQIFDERISQMKQDLARESDEEGNQNLLDLLKSHYRRRFVERHPPVETIRLEPDEFLPGSVAGWYGVERHAKHGVYRWSGPGTVSTVDVALTPNRDFRIEFKIIGALAEDIVENLELRVNDELISTEATLASSGSTIFTGTIPWSTLEKHAGFGRLAFQVPETISTEMLNIGKDSRKVGFALSYIEIFSHTNPRIKQFEDEFDLHAMEDLGERAIWENIQNSAIAYTQVDSGLRAHVNNVDASLQPFVDKYLPLLQPFLQSPFPLPGEKVIQGQWDTRFKRASFEFIFREVHFSGTRYVSNRRVLDIGCNAGYDSFILGTMGASEVVGLEPYAFYYQARFLETIYTFDNVRFHKLGWKGISPESLGTYDIVNCQGVLYHVLDPLQLLSNIVSVLRPGGLVIIETHILEKNSPQALFIEGSFNGDPTYYWIPGNECMVAMMRTVGLTNVRMIHRKKVPGGNWRNRNRTVEGHPRGARGIFIGFAPSDAKK